MFSESFLVTLCLLGIVTAASLNGTAGNNSSDEIHDHEHDSNTKVFLSLLGNGTSSSNSTSLVKNSTSSQPKVRDVDSVKGLNNTSDAFNSTSKNSTNEMRKRQIDEDLKSLNATEDALNSIKSANVTSQEFRAAIPAMKPRKIEDLEDDAVNATENANTTKSSQTIPADAMKPMKREIDLEEVDLLDGPEGVDVSEDDNSTTTRPKLRDLDDVILKALNSTEEDDEADNSTNKASSRLQDRAAVVLNASMVASNETQLKNSSNLASNMTVRAAGNETEVNGTTSTTTTTASPWSILPFFKDLMKAKEDVNDEAENIKTRSVFIIETLNDDVEDDISLDAEPSEENGSSNSTITTTADPQDL